MNIQLECIPCTLNSYLRLANTGVIPESQQEAIFRRMLHLFATIDFNHSLPVLGCKMHALIRESINNPDPYHRIKEESNHMMMDLYPKFEGLINGSEDPFDKAMRLAIAGNVIDFGSQHQLDIMETINRVMDAKLACDHSRQLRVDLEQADSLLYIGDNCGEIVLDKLFLSILNVPLKYFAVRDSTIINDVTHESIYFLLITKCDLIAKRLGTEKEAFIIKKGKTIFHHAK